MCFFIFSYKPYINLELEKSETLEEFYARNEKVVQSAVADTQAEGKHIDLGNLYRRLYETYAVKKQHNYARTNEYLMGKFYINVEFTWFIRMVIFFDVKLSKECDHL